MSLHSSNSLVALLQSSEFALKDLEDLNPEVAKKCNPFIIAPRPDYVELQKNGSASVNLRLGTWFAVFKPGRLSLFDLKVAKDKEYEMVQTKMHYVPFGEHFVLHPRSFVLGVTLEWIRLSTDLGGYLTSRSSWGRRGLIIATASGVHPGFSGCLTLELTNVGEAPIALYPGTELAQFFIHHIHTTGSGEEMDRSRFVGKRKPSLGKVEFGQFAEALATYGSGADRKSKQSEP